MRSFETEETQMHERAPSEARGDQMQAGPMSASGFERQLALLTAVSTAFAVATICAFVGIVLDLSGEQWRGLALVVALSLPAFFGASLVTGRRDHAPIREALAAAERGKVDEVRTRRAYRALALMPFAILRNGLIYWSAGGGFVALVLWLWRDDFSAFAAVATFVAALSGGFVSSMFAAFQVKERFRALQMDFGRRLGPERRQALPTVALRTKLAVAIGSVTLGVIGFVACLTVRMSSIPIEQHAANAISAVLSSQREALSQVLDDAASRDAALAGIATSLRTMGLAEGVALLDGSGHLLSGRPDLLAPVERDAIAAGRSDSLGVTSPHVFAAVPLPGGRHLVGAIAWDALRGDVGAVVGPLAGVLLLAIAGALSLAFVIARDIGSGAAQLAGSMRRVASGDLRAAVGVESEDELGDLGAAFEGMTDVLSAAVRRVAETADHLEEAAAAIAEASEVVAGGAEQQGRNVDLVARSMERVRNQASEIDAETSDLHALVEESSAGVLEIAASSRQLEDSAGGFVDTVGEAGSSVEELVRSVEAVGENTAALVEASGDTSARMQEMAAAMQQADATAAASAELSDQVVAAGERGRERVAETLDGMQSIRAATDTAQAVIQDLVTRVGEIDAIREVIDDVADETNLLALNAAIIAAQAGDHGRSFSVVADEIKELAERVLMSTKEISDVIRAVQNQSHNAVAAIEESSEIVEKGLAVSEQADEALAEITRSSRVSGTRIVEIVSAVREQARASSTVVALMERVREGASAIEGAMSEQARGNRIVLSTTTRMRELSLQLRNTTGEQTRSASGVGRNIEGVSSAVESIVESVRRQIGACGEVASALDSVKLHTTEHERMASTLGNSTSALIERANQLRSDVRRFEVD